MTHLVYASTDDVNALLSPDATMTADSAWQDMADQLHEVIGQPLAALCIGLQAAQQQRLASTLDVQVRTWSALADEVLHALRSLLAGLRSQPHASTSLPDALARHVAPQVRSQGTQCAIYASDWPDDIPADVTTGLYLTIREALMNVQQHARASAVTVMLRGRRRQNLQVVVKDDGVGFALDGATGAEERDGRGLGLTDMRARIRRLGGVLQIESSPGRGTQIEVLVPLEDVSCAVPTARLADVDDTEEAVDADDALPPRENPAPWQPLSTAADLAGVSPTPLLLSVAAPGGVPRGIPAVAARKIRVAVVGDQPLLREGIAALLCDEPQLDVVACGSGDEAFEIAATRHPDVMLLDVHQSGADGIQAIRELKSRFARVRIAMLMSSADDGRILESLAVGADGYLLKDTAPAALIAAISTITAGGQVIDPRIGQQMVELLGRAESSRAETYDGLTQRELQILTMLASGRVAKEVAHELRLSEKTIRNHVYSIYRKLGISDRSQVVMYAVKKGLVPVA